MNIQLVGITPAKAAAIPEAVTEAAVMTVSITPEIFPRSLFGTIL